ncbi:hypothetical protein GPALN_016195 [Globodera pallida]|nr:hypothetical protein GPALN_016195 [Globodera pallida]
MKRATRSRSKAPTEPPTNSPTEPPTNPTTEPSTDPTKPSAESPTKPFTDPPTKKIKETTIDEPVSKLQSIATETPEPLSEETIQLLRKLKQKEKQAQGHQLRKAIQSVKETVAYNNNEDLVSFTKALKKVQELPAPTDEAPNFHDSYHPETNDQILTELSSLESQHEEIWTKAVESCRKQEERKIRSVELQTNNIIDAVNKALKATKFNKGLLEELSRTISSPTYHTRAARDKASICVTKLLDNLSHHQRFLTGQERTAQFLKKTFDLPVENTQSEKPSTSSTSQK